MVDCWVRRRLCPERSKGKVPTKKGCFGRASGRLGEVMWKVKIIRTSKASVRKVSRESVELERKVLVRRAQTTGARGIEG